MSIGAKPFSDSRVVEEMVKIREMAEKAGIKLMVRAGPPARREDAREYYKKGIRAFYWGEDMGLFKEMCNATNRRREDLFGDL